MSNRTVSKLNRRVKKSDKPSPEAVALRPVRESDRASVQRTVADYYDSLTAEEATAQTEWSEFALPEFSCILSRNL